MLLLSTSLATCDHGAVQPVPVTVSSTLVAAPSVGPMPLVVDLTVSVLEETAGPIRFRFDCTSDGSVDLEIITSANPFTAEAACSYSEAGTYTASVGVDFQGELGEATVSILVHLPGPNVEVGKLRYGALCQGCHGDPWVAPPVDTSLVAGRRVTGDRTCSIRRAVFGRRGDPVFPNGVPLMEHLLGVLTDPDIASISAYLNSLPVSGEQRFITTCSSCHGQDARGGPVDEDVRGHDGDDIRDAIDDVGEMGFLSCLSLSDTQVIGSYLGGLDGGDD